MSRCACGKRSFPTEEAADDTLGSIWARCWTGGRRLETRAYQCEASGAWHLTSKPQRPERTDAA